MFYFSRILADTNTTNTDSSSSKCEMFGGFGVLIQTILGVLAFSILIVKRYVEKPRRAWKIWFYDVVKQVISSAFLHLFNLVLSAVLSSDEDDVDACVWYFVTIVLDCTLGAFLSYIFMWLMDGIAKSSDWTILKTGLYYEEYMKNNKKCYKLVWKKYLSQLGVWLVITLVCKLILLAMLKICKLFLVNLGTFFLSPFTNGKIRLVMVMIIIPVIFNALYFWTADNILKFKEDDNGEDNNKNKISNASIELSKLKDKKGNQNKNINDININEIKLDIDSKE